VPCACADSETGVVEMTVRANAGPKIRESM
jgi:hypothetical protein